MKEQEYCIIQSNGIGLTITRLPMGHAVSTTAIQVHSAMSAIGNGGDIDEAKVHKQGF